MLTQDVRHRMNLYPEVVYCRIEKDRGGGEARGMGEHHNPYHHYQKNSY